MDKMQIVKELKRSANVIIITSEAISARLHYVVYDDKPLRNYEIAELSDSCDKIASSLCEIRGNGRLQNVGFFKANPSNTDCQYMRIEDFVSLLRVWLECLKNLYFGEDDSLMSSPMLELLYKQSSICAQEARKISEFCENELEKANLD